MTASLQSAQVYTDLQGLQKLRHKAADQSEESLRAAAQQFEALFVQQMLKTMREAKLADGAFDSDQSEFYLDLFDKQISLNMAQGRGIGLADMIVDQIRQSFDLPQSNAPAVVSQNRSLESRPVTQPSTASVPLLTDTDAKQLSDPQTFLETLWPLAEQASQKLGIDPQVLLAQAALETGWGQHIGQGPDGQSSHNLFNIKAGGNWDGKMLTRATVEVIDGEPVKQYAAFRAYDSFNASFDDYVQLLQSSPRYAPALRSANSPHAFVSALQQAGYATDPDYSQKIMDIATGSTMKNTLAALKTSG
jgi:flagellar protein FlgJ